MENRSPSPKVQTLLDAWVSMWNSYDLDSLPALFVSDDKLSYFSSEREGAFFGMEAVRDHHEGFGFVPGGKVQPNKLWLEDEKETPLGPIAVVTAIWHFLPATRPAMRGPVTFVCVQEGEGFKFAHLSFGNYR